MKGPGCPRLRFERTFVAGGGMEGFGITAFAGKRQVGVIFTRRDDRDSYVSWIEVDPSRRRCGISTKLYEEAARAVCEKYGRPLAVDTERTASTQAFWEKQVQKGRAICVESAPADRRRVAPKPEDAVEGRGGCLYYQLKSCQISDLSGRRRR